MTRRAGTHCADSPTSMLTGAAVLAPSPVCRGRSRKAEACQLLVGRVELDEGATQLLGGVGLGRVPVAECVSPGSSTRS